MVINTAAPTDTAIGSAAKRTTVTGAGSLLGVETGPGSVALYVISVPPTLFRPSVWVAGLGNAMLAAAVARKSVG